MGYSTMRRVAVFALACLAFTLAPGCAQDCIGPAPGPCSLFKRAKVVFVGTVIERNKETLGRRFRVTEAFKGVKGEYVDLVEYPTGMDFEIGKQYLVFAGPCGWAPNPCLTSMPCSGSVPREYGDAVVEQLRAEKAGRPVASVYGTLVRELEAGEGIWVEDYRRPLPNILVRLKSDQKTFEVRTDEHGAYAFPHLPAGKYRVSADLPPNMILGDRILQGPLPPFELPRQACFANDLYALPTGWITGRIIGPDGKPLRLAVANLYQAARYKRGERGAYSLQGKGMPGESWKPFDFPQLPPDDYVLVFNPENHEDPDAPFPWTFYPHASDLAGAEIIHLADGQQVLNADIHVGNPLPTRQITLRFAWNGRNSTDYYRPQVTVEASRGTAPYPFENGSDTYALNLLLNAQYTIHAVAYCQMGTKGEAEAGVATVGGSDFSLSEVTLTFEKGVCVHNSATK